MVFYEREEREGERKNEKEGENFSSKQFEREGRRRGKEKKIEKEGGKFSSKLLLCIVEQTCKYICKYYVGLRL